MMNLTTSNDAYDDLTPHQQRTIDKIIRNFPEYAERDFITLAEIESLYEALKVTQDRIGNPTFIRVKGKKLGRGVYEFPRPRKIYPKVIQNEGSYIIKLPIKVLTEDEYDFYTELANTEGFNVIWP